VLQVYACMFVCVQVCVSVYMCARVCMCWPVIASGWPAAAPRPLAAPPFGLCSCSSQSPCGGTTPPKTRLSLSSTPPLTHTHRHTLKSCCIMSKPMPCFTYRLSVAVLCPLVRAAAHFGAPRQRQPAEPTEGASGARSACAGAPAVCLALKAPQDCLA